MTSDTNKTTPTHLPSSGARLCTTMRASSSDAGRHPLVPIVVFILAAALVAFATNLSMHLLNLRMQKLGVSECDSGLSVAAQALGIVLVAALARYAGFGLGGGRTCVIG